jgi:hypothetical protein
MRNPPVRSVLGWLAGLRPRLVVLSSPHPPAECVGRLALVTAQRGLGAWYRDPQNFRRGDPQLLGLVGPGDISVGRYPEAAGRNSFAPWLEARLKANGDGGTTLTGSIGLRGGVGIVLVVMAVGAAVIAVAAEAGGIGMLATGQIMGLLPVVLSPLAWTALVTGVAFIGWRSLHHDSPKLVNELCGILGASVSLPNLATAPIADGTTF